MLPCDSVRGNLLQVTAVPSLLLSGEVIAHQVRIAGSARRRLRGLVMRPSLSPGEALVLEPAKQIHTFGMRFEIDAVFCDQDWTCVHLVRGLGPCRITRWVRDARRVVEMAAGSLPTCLEVGDRLELLEGSGNFVEPR